MIQENDLNEDCVEPLKSLLIRKMPENLEEILLNLKKDGMEIIPKKNGVNRWKQIRKEADISLESNVLRHTAISYFYRYNPLNKKESIKEEILSQQFGNSTDVRNGYYKNLSMNLADAKKFWSLKFP
mgnify:CR=1 FL=1